MVCLLRSQLTVRIIILWAAIKLCKNKLLLQLEVPDLFYRHIVIRYVNYHLFCQLNYSFNFSTSQSDKLVYFH